MSEPRSSEYFVDAMARAVKELVSHARVSGLIGRVIVDAPQLAVLKNLSEVYLDEGNVELWITACPRDKYISTVKTVRNMLHLGLKEAKNFVDGGIPLKLRSYTSLVEVQKDEKTLSDAGIAFERRKKA